jgi:hypothetical protein
MAKSTVVNLTPVKSSPVGAPYYQLGGVLQSFLKMKKKKTGLTLAQIIRDVHEEWSKRKQRPPAPQTFYMAVYGARPLPVEVLLFMIDRYGLEITFDECFNAMNCEGAAVKSNDVRMPRMRELF